MAANGPNLKQQGVYISTGDWTTVDDPTPYAEGMVGSKTAIKDSDGYNKEIQYVKTDSTMSVNPFPAAVAFWNDVTEFEVTTAATNRGMPAGVFGGTPTKGNYCFIATKGRQTTKFIDAVTSAPSAVGKIVIPSATAGKADCLAAGSAATYPKLGVSAGVYDAVNAEALVDLDVPEVF